MTDGRSETCQVMHMGRWLNLVRRHRLQQVVMVAQVILVRVLELMVVRVRLAQVRM